MIHLVMQRQPQTYKRLMSKRLLEVRVTLERIRNFVVILMKDKKLVAETCFVFLKFNIISVDWKRLLLILIVNIVTCHLTFRKLKKMPLDLI